MRNYIIGGVVFIVVIFFMAIAIGQSDESVDEDLMADAFVSVEPSDTESDFSADEQNTESTHKSYVDIIDSEPETEVIYNSFDTSAIEIPITPSNLPQQILKRVSYTASYNNRTKCPNWVAWHLFGNKTDGPIHRSGVPYYDNKGMAYGIGKLSEANVRGVYITDMEAKPPRQEVSDWNDKLPNNSHGHICPAADNRWSKEAMNQSFLLTNMCPQDMTLNGGDWEDLEERCRGWARRYDDIYIVAGPIFLNEVKKTMGHNKVGVPDAFFKVILRLGKRPAAIGFIFPNEGTHHKLQHYVLSVDKVEEVTGFDFFYNLPDEIENEIEKISNFNKW